MRLRVSSFHHSVTKAMLQEIFEEYGEVTAVKMFRGMNPENSNAMCFIDMPREREAIIAIRSLSGETINGIPLKIEVSNDSIRLKSGDLLLEQRSKRANWDDDDEEDDLDDGFDEDDNEIDESSDEEAWENVSSEL
jgi:RNA recognition motif-containing protein